MGARQSPAVGEDVARQRERPGAQPVDARDLLVEGEDGQLGIARAGQRERQAPVEAPGLDREILGRGGRAQVRRLRQGADRGRGQQPRPLARGCGVGAHARLDRHDGDDALRR